MFVRLAAAQRVGVCWSHPDASRHLTDESVRKWPAWFFNGAEVESNDTDSGRLGCRAVGLSGCRAVRPSGELRQGSDDRPDDCEQRDREATHRDREVINPFGFERIEDERRHVAADEPTQVRAVVDPGEDQPHHAGDQGVLQAGLADVAGPGSAAVIDQRTK